MALLEWKPEYSVGDASIDLEHEHMIHQINKLYDSLSDPVDAANVEAVLGEIHADISAPSIGSRVAFRLHRFSFWLAFSLHRFLSGGHFASFIFVRIACFPPSIFLLAVIFPSSILLLADIFVPSICS